MESEFEVHDEAFLRLIPADTVIERIAGGFTFTEGPVWKDGALLFSDIPNNRIVRWRELPEGPEVTTYKHPSGWPLSKPTAVLGKGSNGLTLDRQGRLLACEHGNRRVTRYEADGSTVTLADQYQGKRLNSPNDIVVRSDGAIFFTDPPYGLVNQSDDQQLPYQGVFRLDRDGSLTLLVDDFERPNGLAFSPDERTLYIDDTSRRHIRAFDVDTAGALSNGRLFAELHAPGEGAPDGMKVDTEGNVYCTGPGGVWVFNASGALLGKIMTPDVPANCGWGGPDWQTLFLTARPSVYRLRVQVPGIAVC